MREITLGGTALQCSRLGFGTSSLHHLRYERERHALLAAAVDAGVTHLDTARMYGEGMAEHALGDFLRGGMRQRVTLASKFGIPASPFHERWPVLMYADRAASLLRRRLGFSHEGETRRDFTPAAAEKSLTQSLRALRTDWLDLLFVHDPRPIDIPALVALADWLNRQKASGRVRYLGVAGIAEVCVAVHRALPGVFDVLQVEDSIDGREADVVLQSGLPLQITYGYLRLAARNLPDSSLPDASSILKAALQRNGKGMVLVSTRRRERLRDIAKLAE